MVVLLMVSIGGKVHRQSVAPWTLQEMHQTAWQTLAGVPNRG
jgi:hypothetical protein